MEGWSGEVVPGLGDVINSLQRKQTDYLRRHGPFEPHRLPLEEMEYTTMPQVMKKLEKRIVNL